MSATPGLITVQTKRAARAPRHYERGAVSFADRKKPSVRIALAISQSLLLIALIVVSLGPLVWLFLAALAESQTLVRNPMGVFTAGQFLWENFVTAWTTIRVGQYLLNTLWVVGGSWFVTIFTCMTGAYVLSVLRPKWGGFVAGAILATLFIPNVISLVPLYLTIIEMPILGISLLDTYWAVWLPHAASPFLLLVFKRFFDAIPPELYEAARIDGAGPIRVFTTIILPMSKPIIGVASLLTIVASWKDFLWPMLVLPNASLQPISVALPRVAEIVPLNIQMAALFLAIIFPVGLFLVLQRYFLEGAGSAGALKG